MPSIRQTDFDGDSNLGLHAEITENFCIINPSLSEKCYERVEDTLDVEPIKTSLANSRMAGIFCAANSKGIALPKSIEINEKTVLRDREINHTIIESKLTALGNLILVNDDACLISPRLEEVKDELKECFEVPVKTAEIAGTDLLGTTAVVTDEGLLSHRDTSEEEMNQLEEVFGLECGRGTANFGKTFVGASLLANSKGVLTGSKTTGPELGRIEEALLGENRN